MRVNVSYRKFPENSLKGSGMARFDEIGSWSEVKLSIIKEYCSAYSTILTKQPHPFHHIYIDAFAGSGQHISRSSGELVAGSPQNALEIEFPFKEYFFIDVDDKKIEALEDIAENRSDVTVCHGDCNQILASEILPTIRFDQYKRALCVLDPYGMDFGWDIVQKAAEMETVEIFLNFSIMDMNRNVLLKNKEKIDKKQHDRMDRFWGDSSWEDIAYKKSPQRSLFGDEPLIKRSNEAIVNSYRKRLKEVAKFKYVAEPVAMKNEKNADIYYWFFATRYSSGHGIATDIFNKYRNRET